MGTNERTELRATVARLKAEAREEKALQRAFEDGQGACLAGEPVTACPLRLPARRNAWERGWRDAERQRAEGEVRRSLSPEERARGQAELAELRKRFPFLARQETGKEN
jgi:ribosome modulation factor